MENFPPLDREELAVIEKARLTLAEIPQVPCTDCRYCMKDCPQHITIPGTFRVINDYLIYHNLETAKYVYGWETGGLGKGKASECVECGQCEAVYPQSILTTEKLAKAAKVLEV